MNSKGMKKKHTLREATKRKRIMNISEETLADYQTLPQGIITTKRKPQWHEDCWLEPRKIKVFPLQSIFENEANPVFHIGEQLVTNFSSWRHCEILSVEKKVNEDTTSIVYSLKSVSSSSVCTGIMEETLLPFYTPKIVEFQQFKEPKKTTVIEGQLQFVL